MMRAQGAEFETISPFLPGDDIRHIDWRATARSGRAQVRRFAAAAHRARCIAVDLHPDLYFGTKGQLMAKTCVLATAKLSWEAMLLNEPVGFSLGVETELARPRLGRRHVERLLARLWRRYHDVAAGAATMSLSSLLDAARSKLRRGDELCLVSDFARVDAEFRRTSVTLAECRTLTAFVVEDPIIRAPLEKGRYPLVTDDIDTVVRIGDRAARHSGTVFDQLRTDRRRALMECGWTVVDALDFLPGRGRRG
jgi:uncharacterized protein (DUF58 family)